MSRRRKKRSYRRRRNPVPNPDPTDLLIGLGLVAIVGGVGYYLYTQSQTPAAATTNPQSIVPASSSVIGGQTVYLNAAGRVIPNTSLTPAQQGALAAINSSANTASQTNAQNSVLAHGNIPLGAQSPSNITVGTAYGLVAPGVNALVPASAWSTTTLPSNVTQGTDANGNVTFTANTAGSSAILGTYNGTAYSISIIAS